jgi:hypothetical protein
MQRRPAITLIEALMAIFVMAIGLLALLTLFPLGAVQMAQALKDERTAQASIAATTQFKGFDLANDGAIDPITVFGPPTQYRLFENPWPGTALLPMTSGVSTSYPVYVDVIGVANGASVPVANAPLGIPRTSVGNIPQLPTQTTVQWAARWFTLQDDLTYADNGVADLAGLGNPFPTVPPPNYVGQNTITREGRYTWAYMLRRQTSAVASPPPTPASPPVPPINLTVVVYSGRSPGVDFAGNPLGETLYTNVTYGPSPDNSPNIVRIDWTGLPNRPTLRRGSWVLDARMLPSLYVTGLANLAPGATLTSGISKLLTFPNVPQAYFYRVVSVNDVGTTVMDVEIQRPLGGQLRGPYGPNAAGVYYTGPLVVVENVSEVFEKDTNY